MKRGFTLIELLAVIVILAIIALIAVPIVLNIINEAEESSLKRSVEMYGDAVQNAFVMYKMKENDDPNEFSDIEKYINYNGSKVECKISKINVNGTIYLNECSVNGKLVNNYSYGKNQSNCKLLNGDLNTVGSEIACGTEHFYIIPQDLINHTSANENTISMLSKHNINVGDYPYPGDAVGIQSSNLDERTCVNYNIEYNYCTAYYGAVGYGYDSTKLAYTFAYDSNEQIYPYVDEYENYLKSTYKLTTLSANVMSLEQIKELGCSQINETCNNKNLELLSKNSFWLGSMADTNGVRLTYYGDNTGTFLSSCFSCYTAEYGVGIRPVIIIDKSEIEV